MRIFSRLCFFLPMLFIDACGGGDQARLLRRLSMLAQEMILRLDQAPVV